MDAVRALTFDLPYGRYGDLGEAAVQGCLDHMEPPGRLDMVGQRIDDRALLHLSRQWLKAGMLDPDGPVGQPATGTPPSGTVSAVLANVYLHYALALWVEQVVKPHCRGAALLCREADAWVWAFRLQEEVERFCRVLPQRFAQFNLQVAPQKTHRHRCSRVHPSPKRRFTCLGCECFWRPDRHGVPRVLRRTARQTLPAACPRLTQWSKQPRHLPGRVCFQRRNARRRGHEHYEGVRGNARSLQRCVHGAMDCMFKWLNQRGGKRRSYPWEQCPHVLASVKIARPRITEVPRRSVLA